MRHRVGCGATAPADLAEQVLARGADLGFALDGDADRLVVGIYPIVPLKEYSLDLWDEVQSVNVRSVFQIVQLLSPAFAKGGRIVLIGSGAGHIGSRDIGYSASKAALLGMVRTLARSLAPAGILVNAVCPGLVATPMSARMKTEDVQDYMTRIPLGRKGTPGEVAVCVSFLLEEENSYMTGASLDVNGGLYTR